MSYIALDLETIADPGLPPELMPGEDEVSAPSNYKDPAKIAEYVKEKRQSIIDKFALDPLRCQIIAVGMSVYEINGHEPTITDSKIFTYKGGSYKTFLQETADYLGEGLRQRILVTFNGKKFDLPVLRVHYAMNQINFRGHFGILLRRFAPEHHLDLHEQLDLGSLAKLTKRFGRSTYGSGSDVGIQHKKGEWAEIEKHLEEDVKQTINLHADFNVYL